MGNNVSVEFLETMGFSLRRYPDGFFYVKWWSQDHFMQCDEHMTHFTEYNEGWIDELTEKEFIDTIISNNKAINQ